MIVPLQIISARVAGMSTGRISMYIRRKLMILVSICTLLSPLFFFQGTHTAFAVQAKPMTDWSFYMFQPDSNEAYTLGCNQGNFDAGNGNINSSVILDVGGQTSSTNYSTIEFEVEQMAAAYYNCTGHDSTSVMRLAVGTNNSASVTYSGGVAWANMLTTLDNWLSSTPYSTQVAIIGANDIEPSFSDVTSARNWISGYMSVSSRPNYLDFGSADGCPPSSFGPCNNGWSQEDLYYVSWGADPAQPVPEIYYGVNAQQWAEISLYGVQNHNTRVLMVGPMDEYDRDSSTLTSDQSWNNLWTDLNNNSSTAQNMTYSYQIHAISF